MVTPNKNRVAIYAFYDQDGIVDRYVEYFLKELKKTIDRLVIVVNGKLTPVGRDILSCFTEDLIVRKNEGFDIYGYKEGLEYIGWEKLREYYEVLLINSSLMGPVFPFQEMFDEMDKEENLDFWGVTKHGKIDYDPFNANPFGYIPEHIQSSFTVYRNKFLKTRDLENYWTNLPEIQSYFEAIGKHESYFTKCFSDMGYRCGVYVDQEDDLDKDTE